MTTENRDWCDVEQHRPCRCLKEASDALREELARCQHVKEQLRKSNQWNFEQKERGRELLAKAEAELARERQRSAGLWTELHDLALSYHGEQPHDARQWRKSFEECQAIECIGARAALAEQPEAARDAGEG